MGSTSAVSGINGWMALFDRSAAAVSAATVSNSDLQDLGSASSDLVDGMIGMRMAANGIKANVAVLRTTDEMLGTLLDMHA